MTNIWRCTECKKWSHAKKKPKSHERFTSVEPDDDSRIIEYMPGEYSHINGFIIDPGWMVKCGPFDTYEARKVKS